MKLFTSFLLLALVSAPVFSAFTDDTATMLAAADGDATDVEFIRTALDTATDYATTVGIVEADYTSAAADSAAILAILGALDVADLATQLGTVDTAIDTFALCGVAQTGGDTDCVCGGVFTAVSVDDTCAEDTDLTDDVIATIENWVGYAKVSGTAALPYFSADDLAAFADGTGAWENASCYAEDTWVDDCLEAYTVLRALWDDGDVSADALTDGGLDATTLATVLYEYEVASDDGAEIFLALAGLFDDSDDAAWTDDLLEDLAGLFCDADGALNDAEATVAAVADFEAGDFYAEDFTAFLGAGAFDLETAGADLTDAEAADWLWVDALCPGAAGTSFAANIDAWIELFTELDGEFDLTPTCNAELTADVAEGSDDYVDGGASDTACPVCLDEAAIEALTEDDDDFALAALRSSEEGSLHFCQAAAAAAAGAGAAGEGAAEDKLDLSGFDSIEDACGEDEEAETYEACVAAWELMEELAAGREFVMGISLLATLALLWK